MSQSLNHLGQIIGHRGVAALAPENTLESFALALQYGLKSVEFDVCLSVDGTAFLFHDQDLKRTTNGQGKIGLVTADYLKSLDAGSWFSKDYQQARIPTFREALLWLKEHNVSANIEIKPFPGAIHETVKVVLSDVNELWPKTHPLPLISSFEVEVLRLCQTLQPNTPRGYILHTWHSDVIELAKSLACCSVNLNYRIASASRINALQKQGFAVYIYTINYQYLISKFFALGVDGVFSDYPSWRLET